MSRFNIITVKNKSSNQTFGKVLLNDKNWYHIYLIDIEAKIKDGDWYLKLNSGNYILMQATLFSIKLYNEAWNPCEYYKIIASTNKDLNVPSKSKDIFDGCYILSEQSIKLIVNFYNKNNVIFKEIELDKIVCDNECTSSKQNIILNNNGELDIIIDKLYSSNDVINILHKYVSETTTNNIRLKKYFLNKLEKWIEHKTNLKL